MDLTVLIVALGFVFIIEGIPYVASPQAVKRFTALITTIPERVLRAVGIAALLIGLVLVYLGARVLH
ncbi:MAG: DUF2065 domain-containing protein [Deltaproteobacteria bacterium]|jgi:uncharacterized protein YjeT (DUF2065 family)|nr:DUF2065 domain-containing protein [Candidatus Zymogenaceae bacterium]